MNANASDRATSSETLSGLARWRCHSPIPPAMQNAMLAHPAFPAAARTLAANMLEVARADRTLAGIFQDAGHYACGMCAIYLHVLGGITLPTLKALCADTGLLSPGRARAVLIYMRYLKFVACDSPRNGTRPAVYAPTPRFLASWQCHLIAALRAVVLIEPEVAVLVETLTAASAFETYARLHIGGLLAEIPHVDLDQPFMRAILSRRAGTSIAAQLLSKGDGDFPPHDAIAFSVAATARAHGVSRMHVRRMLRAAETEGLLRRHGDRLLTFSSEGRTEIRLFYAVQLIRLLAPAARMLLPD